MFDESRFFSHHKELELSREECLLPNTPPEGSQEKYPCSSQKAGTKSDPDNEKFNEYSSNLFTPVSTRTTARRMTENLDNGHKKIFFKKQTNDLETVDTLSFPHEKVQENMNVFIQENFRTQSSDKFGILSKSSQESNKDSFLKRLKEDTAKKSKFKAISKNKHVPTIQITNSVLQSSSSR